MPRRSSFSSNQSPSRRSHLLAGPKPKPSPQRTSSRYARYQPSFGDGLLSSVATGFAFGAGASAAHEAVRGLAGSLSKGSAAENQPLYLESHFSKRCDWEIEKYKECLEYNSNQTKPCQAYADVLRTCQSKFIQ